MGDVKGQKKRNLEESQEKQLDGAWLDQGCPSSGAFPAEVRSLVWGAATPPQSSSSSPWLLTGLGTSLFLARVCLWGVFLRLSINFFLLKGSHTVVGFPHFCGTAGNCGCKASKGHRQYRSPSQLSPSLWQKLSAISLLSPSFSARAGMLFWICTSRAMKAIDLLKQTPRPQAK